MKAILGKKIGMTQIFQGEKVVPVTLVEAGPCRVLQIKTKETDEYEATQLGFEQILNTKKIKKTQRGKEFRYIKEFRIPEIPGAQKVGEVIDVSVFQEGDKVKISGISKGKGFQGAVKRHGFSGRNATHGVKHEERTLGSVGMRWPQRVIRGRRMPGRMGFERVTVKNAKIVKIDKEQNLLAIKGAIPGRRGTLLEIRG
ncbi:MAG: 50S ribosomal protein L3 [Patescibacteria group bacterium]